MSTSYGLYGAPAVYGTQAAHPSHASVHSASHGHSGSGDSITYVGGQQRQAPSTYSF